jgi:osmotically-inducible protein OsmY
MAKAEEGDIFTGPQAIDEKTGDSEKVTRPKGALEPGGQPLGQTAPLNGDRSANNTAQNQSSRPESVRITRNIRQQIIERDDLSTSAKNVKIITDEKGAVTLRGPVKTSNERQAVEQIARNNAQGGQVNNELIVKGREETTGGAHG